MNKSKNIFINSGIRNKFNQDFLKSKNIKTLGYTLGYVLAQEFEISCPILIATDTRPSGISIKQDIVEGLLAFGHDVFDAGICPTPFVAKALKDYQPEENDDHDEHDPEEDDAFFTLGLVITASHNPAEYNGIKILTPFGYLSQEMELELSEIFYDFSENLSEVKKEIQDEPGIIVDFDLVSWYHNEIIDELEQTPYNASILLDCANGATAQIAPKIFQLCGFTTVAINNSLDGKSINADSGCAHSEKLLKDLQEHKTEWACAFDGDGDRVIIAHRNGTIFNGDDIVAILAQHARYSTNPIIVGTIMTNQGLQNYLQQLHKKLIRTPVGERNIINALIQQQAFLGSEPCGHITMMDHAFCSDGIFAALMFFQTLITQKITPWELYQKHPQMHASLNLNNKNIDTQTIQNIIKKHTLTTGRIIVRPSNTEPVLRIMVEHPDENITKIIMQNLKNDFEKELK